MSIEAYFDGGGHERQKYLVVAGFISNPENWADFEKKLEVSVEEGRLKLFPCR